MWDRKRTQALEDQLRETRDIAVEARTTVLNHQATCVEHNRRIEDMLAQGRDERDRQHAENKQNIELIHGRVSSLSNRITMLIISALGMTVAACIAALYEIFAKKVGF